MQVKVLFQDSFWKACPIEDRDLHFVSSHVLLKSAHEVMNHESASQTLRMWHGAFSRLWKRQADPSDFVWLGRFRLLSLYTILKGLLLVAAGGIGASISSLQSRSLLSQTPHLWLGIILGLTIATLLIIAGLVLASKDRPRSIGLVTLGASDICVLLAVAYAFILNNLFLLLIILVFISSTTPLLIERISRYAKRFLKEKTNLRG